MYYTRNLGMDLPLPLPDPISNIKFDVMCKGDHRHNGYMYMVVIKRGDKMFSYENWTEIKAKPPDWDTQEHSGRLTITSHFGTTDYPAWNEPYVIDQYCEHCGTFLKVGIEVGSIPPDEVNVDHEHSTEHRVECKCGKVTTIGQAKFWKIREVNFERSYKFGFHLFPDYWAAVRGKQDMLPMSGELHVVKVWYRKITACGLWKKHAMFLSDKICVVPK